MHTRYIKYVAYKTFRYKKIITVIVVYSFLGRIAALARSGLLLQTKWRGLSVCLSVTSVSPAKPAEPIEMPFGMWIRASPRNYVLDGVQILHGKGHF